MPKGQGRPPIAVSEYVHELAPEPRGTRHALVFVFLRVLGQGGASRSYLPRRSLNQKDFNSATIQAAPVIRNVRANSDQMK